MLFCLAGLLRHASEESSGSSRCRRCDPGSLTAIAGELPRVYESERTNELRTTDYVIGHFKE